MGNIFIEFCIHIYKNYHKYDYEDIVKELEKVENMPLKGLDKLSPKEIAQTIKKLGEYFIFLQGVDDGK